MIVDIRVYEETCFVEEYKAETKTSWKIQVKYLQEGHISDWIDVPVVKSFRFSNDTTMGQNFDIDPSSRDWEYDAGGIRVYKDTRRPYP